MLDLLQSRNGKKKKKKEVPLAKKKVDMKGEFYICMVSCDDTR